MTTLAVTRYTSIIGSMSTVVWWPLSCVGRVRDVCRRVLAGGFQRVTLPYLDRPKGPTFTHTVQECLSIYDPTIVDANFLDKERVWEVFSHREEKIIVAVQGETYRVKVKFFETNQRKYKRVHTCIVAGGNVSLLDICITDIYPFLSAFTRADNPDKIGLRLIQVTFYSIDITRDEEFVNYNLSSTQEIGQIFLNLLSSLKENNGINVDSVMCHSLGSTFLDGLKDLKEKEAEAFPKTLILDRAFPSFAKVAHARYGWCASYILSFVAHLSGWYSNPEDSLLTFYRNMHATGIPLSDRKVIIIEVDQDHIFSGPHGCFSENYHRELSKCDVETYKRIFYGNSARVNCCGFHGLPLCFLKNDNRQESGPFPLRPYESVAEGIVRCLFLVDEQ